MYKGCSECLRGLHPSMFHRTWCMAMYKRCSESMTTLHPSWSHRKLSTAKNRSSGESSRCLHPSGFMAGGLMLWKGLRGIPKEYRRCKDSLHVVYCDEEALR